MKLLFLLYHLRLVLNYVLFLEVINISHTNNLKKKQHYVAQVYLRNFSLDKKNIYFLELSDFYIPKKTVPIKSQCYEKNLYEMFNEKGERINPNYLENILAVLERKYGPIINSLSTKLDKGILPENDVISDEDRLLLFSFIAIQILRSPRTLNTSNEFLKETLGIEDYLAKNTSLSLCLPFFSELNEGSILFNYVINPLLDMKLNLAVAENNFTFFTSDFPVFVLKEKDDSREYDKVIFPLTNKLCLMLYGNSYKEDKIDNKVIVINKDLFDEINWSIAYSANRKIYFDGSLSKEQLFEIKRARINFKELTV